MKDESVLDLLMYLFEHYMDEESHLQADPDTLKQQLQAAGFQNGQISKAFDWLEGLNKDPDAVPVCTLNLSTSLRVFSPEECHKLDLQARGYLIFLEQIGVLDPDNRELIIDRVMALENEDIDLDQLKWVILMVLFNQPEFEEAFNWVEHVVLDDQTAAIH
jgi:Smg protein